MSCGLEHGANVGGGEAALAEGAEGEGVVAFGEADAVLVGEELSVEVVGRWEVESTLKEDLAGGGFEEVSAADYFSDVHGCIVDYAG